MNTQKNFLRLILAAMMVLSFSGLVLAQEKVQQKAKGKVKTSSVMKEVEGVMSGMTKRSISIVYGSDAEKGIEYEILLPFAKEGIKVEHKKNLSELAQGDTVRVSYEEVIEENEQGEKKEGRRAKVISFIRAAEKKSESQALVSEEPLTLKGTK
jgi:hypothetical protein